MNYRNISLGIAIFLGSLLYAGATSRSMILTATERDKEAYSAPVLGNGQLGVVMDLSGMRPDRVFSATAVERGRNTTISSITPVISALRLNVKSNGKDAPVSNWSQNLDLSTGTVTTSYRLPGLEVRCSMTALRSLPCATMAELEVKALQDVTVEVTDQPLIPGNLADGKISRRNFNAGHKPHQLLRAEATYNLGHDAVVSTVGLEADGWQRISADSLQITLKKGSSASLWAVASTVNTADFADPWNESERQVLFAVSSGKENLVKRHADQWASLWKSDITIEGNQELQQVARVALYNLYASTMPGSGRSIAPMGLTSRHYYGHVFWDADTWMLPVMAVLQPEIARDMVEYRIATLPQARSRAAAYGYDGAMYAWESDDLGEESTPTFALTGPLEHHVTADVARGAWLYFCASADTTWLESRAWPLLKDCADYWVSRASRNADGSYSIKNVVGADEYAINVDDNAFTNAAALRALQYAGEAARILGYKPDPQWLKVASNLRFPRIEGTDVISEYEGYDGARIKQADVALLAFPLNLLTDRHEIEANLDYYDTKIDTVGGPAMSHSAMAVNYARMGNGERAAKLVEKSFRPNLRGPFLNLSESPNNNHVYFITGAGGLLQALVFGYAGMEIDTDSGGVKQVKSSLPANVRHITVTTPYGTFKR